MRKPVLLDQMDAGVDLFVEDAKVDEDAHALLKDPSIRLRILRMLADEAFACGSTVAIVVQAIDEDVMGPVFTRSFDDLVQGLGLPRSKVIEIIHHIAKPSDTWPGEVALLCTIYGPSIPTAEQGKEIFRFATSLKRRAERQAEAIGQALEMVKAATG